MSIRLLLLPFMITLASGCVSPAAFAEILEDAPSVATQAQAPVQLAALDPELARALAATNQERAAVGAPALVWSAPLAAIAEAHSRDMVARGFFEHDNPDGLSPFDRMAAAHITYGAAAENIAQNNADDGDGVIDQWMHSPGHRANILSPAYRQVGLGVARNDRGERYWTQDFTD